MSATGRMGATSLNGRGRMRRVCIQLWFYRLSAAYVAVATALVGWLVFR